MNYQCRCGARRIRQLSGSMSAPPEQGWPPLTDRHGVPVMDSGWHRPNVAGSWE